MTDIHAPIELSVCEVPRVLKQVNERKSSGLDGLSCKILKVCHMELCDIFTGIFNESLMFGIIYALWKTVTIIPIPKKYQPSVLNDYIDLWHLPL